MASELENNIQRFFRSPLQRGEQRKILYLYDKDQYYLERLTDLSKKSSLFNLLIIDDHHYIYMNYQIEKERVDENLLLYLVMDRPPDRENPLLDVLLYSKELKIDKESLLYTAIGIDSANAALTQLASKYQNFFNAKERTSKFKRLYQQSITQDEDTMELCILAVLTKADQPHWISILIEIFHEWVKGQSKRWESIQKFGNIKRFWRLVDRLFGFNAETSISGILSIDSLVKQLFATHLASEWQEELPSLLKRYQLPKRNQVIIFINQWMNLKNQQESYIEVADCMEQDLGISALLKDLPLASAAQMETFKAFDVYLIEQLADQIQKGNADYQTSEQLITNRRGTFWYKHYRLPYHTLRWSTKFYHSLDEIRTALEEVATAEGLWKQYEEKFYAVDQAYRKWYSCFDQLEAFNDAFEPLKEQIERQYHWFFLNQFTEKWDHLLLKASSLNIGPKQQDFYLKEIQPLLEQDRKTFVIISDALRYEAGQELFQRLVEEKRFRGTITSMQTAIPSYTALGMAALLPHQQLAVEANGEVTVDGLATNSVEKRNSILQQTNAEKAMAIRYGEITQMNRDELRKAFSGKKLVYIYHNHIDAIGDQRTTENEVFSAVGETLYQLKRLLTRLATEVSAKQLFVTADHGFLYSRSPIQPAEKITLEQGIEEAVYNKRFILTNQETHIPSTLSFSLAEQINSSGYVTVPRSTNRFALAGGGYQYVHGGHLPQETMVPLLAIQTQRGRNELPQVSVSLLTQTRTLTNSIIWLEFLQLNPVSESLKEKRLSIYFEDDQGNKISNEVLLIADNENSSSQERIIREKFVLLNQNYASFAECHLVMENIKEENDKQKETFKIDIANHLN